MLRHTNTKSNSIATKMLLLMILAHTVSFSVYIVLSYCLCFLSLAIQPIYQLLFIFLSAMIQLSNYAHLLIRGMMFSYYTISNIYTCFGIAILKSKAVGLELKPEYTNAYASYYYQIYEIEICGNIFSHHSNIKRISL